MQYNSTKEHLLFPEYGRHVQEMIHYAKTIEKDEERQAFAEMIIDLMQFIGSQDRFSEGRDKLWMHFFKIADYDIEVLPPTGIKPTPEDHEEPLVHMEYPQKNPKYRHYGNNIMAMVEKVKTMEDQKKRDAFIRVLGSYMKMAYKNWNKEHYVNDEVIKNDLTRISNGEIVLDDSIVLNHLDRSHSSSYSNHKRRRSGYKKSNRDRGRRR